MIRIIKLIESKERRSQVSKGLNNIERVVKSMSSKK
jgi:hypothetical protein